MSKGHGQVAKQAGCKSHARKRCIHIDLRMRILRAFKNGHLERVIRPISGGKADHPTTRGTFHIDPRRRYPAHRSNKYPEPNGGAPMNYSLFYHGGEAIHEGNPHVLSHGCIHVGPHDAARLFRWVGNHSVTVVIQ